jgi:hypothetical protein
LLALGGFIFVPIGGRPDSVRGLALFDTGGLLLGRRPITRGFPFATFLDISPITRGLDNGAGGFVPAGSPRTIELRISGVPAASWAFQETEDVRVRTSQYYS